ncbi:MAG: hypothetical protein CML47_10540 [Rhodobacteraceae bacterium]|nr:MAG: hypothetical protein CML47_10540 [Paracoccaceae bacterium]
MLLKFLKEYSLFFYLNKRLLARRDVKNITINVPNLNKMFKNRIYYLIGLLSLAARSAVAIKLTSEQINNYQRDGVIVVKRLIRGRKLRKAQSDAKILVKQSKSLRDIYRHLSFQGWYANKKLRNIAFNSPAPRIAAQLMGLDKKQPLRVMKDALLALSPGDKACGWHVDDKIFWPCYDDSKLGAANEGINVWITLSPLRAKEGGGLAVAPGSSNATWREKCRGFIGTFTPGAPPITCELATLSPKCNRLLESMKTLHDMEPGDAIFHSRYCFHKGETFDEGETKLRYSIRYMPSSARLFDNGHEIAIRKKGLSDGALISDAGEYYPQVWPYSIFKERWRIWLGLR